MKCEVRWKNVSMENEDIYKYFQQSLYLPLYSRFYSLRLLDVWTEERVDKL